MTTSDAWRRELSDPRIEPARLAEIAANAPELGAEVAAHPQAYAGLLDWLEQFGDDRARAAVRAVRAPGGAADAAQGGIVADQTPVVPGRSGSLQNPFLGSGPGPVAPSGYAGSPLGRAPRPRGRKPVVVGVAIGAAALLVIGGGVAAAVLLPRVLPSASPEAAAERLLTSVAGLDYVSLASSIAPSESSLLVEPLQELRSVALDDEQGSAPSAGDVLSRLQRAASIDIDGLVFDREDLAPGVALVTLTEGSITIDGDPDEIASALAEFTGISQRQYWESAGFSDEEIAEYVEQERERIADSLDLPFEIDIEQITEDSGIGYSLFSVVAVDEGGWYVSPLMSAAQYTVGVYPYYTGNPLAYGDEIVEPDISSTPEEAVQSTFDAITDATAGRDYFEEIAATLPLPERRLLSIYGPAYAEIYGYDNPWQIASSGDVTVTASGDFRDAEMSGSIAEVTSWSMQIEYSGNDRYTSVSIEDHCLDFSWYSEYYDSYWEEWTTSSDAGSYCLDDSGLGLDFAALGIDEPSMIAVRSGDGWQFSALSTAARIATDAARTLAELSRDGDLDEVFARSALTPKEAL